MLKTFNQTRAVFGRNLIKLRAVQYVFQLNPDFFEKGHLSRFVRLSFCYQPSPKLILSVQPHKTLRSYLTYNTMSENKYVVGYAKLGTSGCKKCKSKIEKGGLRIGKVVSNPFSEEGGDMKQWYHPQCMFETFKRARATTKKIEEPDDMEGFGNLQQEDKDVLKKMIDGECLFKCTLYMYMYNVSCLGVV